MLFFNDIQNNIYDTERLGVVSILVTHVTQFKVLMNGLKVFFDKRHNM